MDEQTDQAPLAALQLGLFNLARGDEPQTECDRFTKAGYRPVWVDSSARRQERGQYGGTVTG